MNFNLHYAQDYPFNDTYENQSFNINDAQQCPFLIAQDDFFFNVSKELNNFDINEGDIIKETYYSENNIAIIQNMLQKKIYESTPNKYIIPLQKREHLIQIMDGIYHDYAQHLPFNQKEQVITLNNILVDTCYPYIIKQIDGIYNYVQTINKPLQMLPRPETTSTTGTKTLPSTLLL